MIELRPNPTTSHAGARFPLGAVMLAALALAMTIPAGEVEAQANRAARLQKKIEKAQQRRGANKLDATRGSSGDSGSETATASAGSGGPQAPAKNVAQTGGHSLDGVKEKGLRGLFRKDEANLIIRGLGNPATLIIVFRQLDLSDQQKEEIKAIGMRLGNRLVLLRNEHQQLDQQLTDAIYGDNFDPKRVDELAAKVAEKQGEITRLRANTEAQLRQLMTPDQFFVFHWLLGEMVLPQRRIPPAQLRQMMQRRPGFPGRPGAPDLP